MAANGEDAKIRMGTQRVPVPAFGTEETREPVAMGNRCSATVGTSGQLLPASLVVISLMGFFEPHVFIHARSMATPAVWLSAMNVRSRCTSVSFLI